MKVNCLYIPLLFSIGSVYAQNVKVEYRFNFLLNNDQCRSQLIIPNENISFYEMFDIKEETEEEVIRETDEDGNPKVAVMAGGSVHKNRIVMKKRAAGTVDYYKVENDSYTKISEKLNLINWELLDGTKNILGYKCLQAKGLYRGKYYDAWYASDIPYSDGPWKFNGLPGLILEISSKDKNLSITADKIVLNAKQLPAIKVPDFEETYTWKEYVNNKQDELKTIKKRILSDMPEGEHNSIIKFSIPEIDTTFTVE